MSAPANTGPRASFDPSGFRPKKWTAEVGGKTLTDARGAARRYSTEDAALRAAIRAHAMESAR